MKLTTKFGIYAIIVIVALMLLIELLIGDAEFFLLINKQMSTPLLDAFCLYVLIPLFSLLVIIPFALIALDFHKNKQIFTKEKLIWISVLASGAISYLLGSLVKFIFVRERPFRSLDANIVGPWHASYYSFPSTTTMLAFGIAFAMLIKKPRLGCPMLLLAFLVGFTVIYTGFHYPADVISGILFSIPIAFVVTKCADLIEAKLPR